MVINSHTMGGKTILERDTNILYMYTFPQVMSEVHLVYIIYICMLLCFDD